MLMMIIITTTMMLMMLMIIIIILRMMMTMLFGNDDNTQHLWKPLKTLFYRPIQLRKLPVYNPEDERIGDLFGWKFCDFDCWRNIPSIHLYVNHQMRYYPMIQNVTSEKGKLGDLFFAFMWRRPADMKLKLDNGTRFMFVGVSLNGGTPKSSILIGFSIINHPFWGTPIFGNTHIYTFAFGCSNRNFYMFHSFYHAWVALQFAQHVIHNLIVHYKLSSPPPTQDASHHQDQYIFIHF